MNGAYQLSRPPKRGLHTVDERDFFANIALRGIGGSFASNVPFAKVGAFAGATRMKGPKLHDYTLASLRCSALQATDTALVKALIVPHGLALYSRPCSSANQSERNMTVLWKHGAVEASVTTLSRAPTGGAS